MVCPSSPKNRSGYGHTPLARLRGWLNRTRSKIKTNQKKKKPKTQTRQRDIIIIYYHPATLSHVPPVPRGRLLAADNRTSRGRRFCARMTAGARDRSDGKGNVNGREKRVARRTSSVLWKIVFSPPPSRENKNTDAVDSSKSRARGGERRGWILGGRSERGDRCTEKTTTIWGYSKFIVDSIFHKSNL